MTNDDRNQKKEELELLFHQLEDFVRTGMALKTQVECLLENDERVITVREPGGNYHTKKQTDVALMPDYHIDDNGKITDVFFQNNLFQFLLV